MEYVAAVTNNDGALHRVIMSTCQFVAAFDRLIVRGGTW